MLGKLGNLVRTLLDKHKPYRKVLVALAGAVALAATLYLQDDALSTGDWKLVGLELLTALGVWGVPNATRKRKVD